MHHLFFALLFLSHHALAQAPLNITVDPVRFQVDTAHQLILCQTDLSQYASLEQATLVQFTVSGTTYVTSERQTELSYASSYPVQGEKGTYQLFFTQLPIVSIYTQDTIIDLEKVDAQLTYVAHDEVVTSFVGIETRGGSSQYFPKKTYDLELWEDTVTEVSRDLQFGQLRSDDDWILDALYNEPLRIRSFMTHKLWLAMHSPTYQDQEPAAKAGADVMWVEVFLQGAYQGVYALSEQVDRKLLKLKKFKEEEIRGELFKTEQWSDAVLLRKAPPFNATSRDWEYYQMKYPGQEEATDWGGLYGFVSFVVNTDSISFVEGIDSLFNITNAVDYFILINAVRASDNYGKNIYVARYTKGAPYFYVPWDLDATWGQRWDGVKSDVVDKILCNRMYVKLLRWDAQGFNTYLSSRWYELRNGVLSDAAIAKLLDQTHATLLNNNVYEREQRVWSEYAYDTADLTYLKSWTERRLAYLDDYFFDPVLDVEDDMEEEETIVAVYPNPSRSSFRVNLPANYPVPYQLLNVHGVVMRSGIVNPNGSVVNVANLPRGHYLFRAEGSTQRVLVVD